MNLIAAHSLPVMETFYSLQGEGFHQGKAAYFIRLGGCDVGCFWCDVKESWDVNNHKKIFVEDIVKNAVQSVKSQTSNLNQMCAVITGGEPLMHNLNALTHQLKNSGFKTHIETSGSHFLSGTWDWICVSPKKFKAPLPEILPLANELKIIIYNKHDFKWAEQFVSKLSSSCKLYLQPEWENAAIVTPLIVDYIKKNPAWELSLQIHKYINVP